MNRGPDPGRWNRERVTGMAADLYVISGWMEDELRGCGCEVVRSDAEEKPL